MINNLPQSTPSNPMIETPVSFPLIREFPAGPSTKSQNRPTPVRVSDGVIIFGGYLNSPARSSSRFHGSTTLLPTLREFRSIQIIQLHREPFQCVFSRKRRVGERLLFPWQQRRAVSDRSPVVRPRGHAPANRSVNYWPYKR